jgi:hypothetical protein
MLNGCDFVFWEFNDPPAANTSQVAVISVTVDMFIMEVAILEIDLLDQSTFNEQRKGSVDRGLANGFVLVPQTKKKLIHIEVTVNRENGPDDRLPFRSVPQPFLLDKFPKFLNFIHDRSIIIIEIH